MYTKFDHKFENKQGILYNNAIELHDRLWIFSGHTLQTPNNKSHGQ
jgi:hypothetical protein